MLFGSNPDQTYSFCLLARPANKWAAESETCRSEILESVPELALDFVSSVSHFVTFQKTASESSGEGSGGATSCVNSGRLDPAFYH